MTPDLGTLAQWRAGAGEAKSREINENLQSAYWDSSLLPLLGFQNADQREDTVFTKQEEDPVKKNQEKKQSNSSQKLKLY